MNTRQKVVEVGAPRSSELDRWLRQGMLALVGLALAGWMCWLFG